MASPVTARSDPPRRVRAVRLAPPEVIVEREAGGVIRLRSPHDAAPYAGESASNKKL